MKKKTEKEKKKEISLLATLFIARKTRLLKVDITVAFAKMFKKHLPDHMLSVTKVVIQLP